MPCSVSFVMEQQCRLFGTKCLKHILSHRLQFQCLNVKIILIFSLMSAVLCSSAKIENLEKIGKGGVTISLIGYDVVRSPGEVSDTQMIIAPSSMTTISVMDIPVDVSFVLIQTHTFLQNISLSYNRNLSPNTYVNGSNIGLVKQTAGLKSCLFFVHNPSPVMNITILVAVQAYGSDAPVPGGCNMEFPVEIAPFLRLTESFSRVIVDSQPPAPSSLSPDCEFQYPSEVVMYHMYLPEMDFSISTYFKAIRAMMAVQDIKNNALEAQAPVVGPGLRRTFSAYRGTGRIFGAVAVSGFSGSAYVPAVTYSCVNLSINGTCDVLDTTFSKLLCAAAFFLGLFTCLFGHKFFKTEMFLLGFLAGGILGFILLSLVNTLTLEVIESVSVVMGIIYGIVWLLLWYFYGVPVVSVLLASLTFGFVTAAIAMYYGLADVDVLQSDTNFWVLFLCIMLIIPLVFTPVINKANMIICAVLGAYAVIIPIDYYIGSNLKYVIINIIRRATVAGFNVAIIDPPFQIRDIFLVATWIVLSMIGFATQWYLQRGKPPFPPPPYRTRQRRFAERSISSYTPLLRDARVPYGAAESTVVAEQPFPFLPKMRSEISSSGE